MKVLGDQSVGRSTEAGGLGGYSVGHWALSKFKRKRNDERLSGRVPPSQGPAARKEPYKETGGVPVILGPGKQAGQTQNSQKRTPSHPPYLGPSKWSVESVHREPWDKDSLRRGGRRDGG